MLDTEFQLILDDPRDAHEPAGSAPPREDHLLDAYSNAVSRIAADVGPAVVRVDTRRGSQAKGGTGSGFIISPDGLILTNSHVVNGFRDIRLADADGRTTDAQLIGEDPDLSLIHI